MPPIVIHFTTPTLDKPHIKARTQTRPIHLLHRPIPSSGISAAPRPRPPNGANAQPARADGAEVGEGSQQQAQREGHTEPAHDRPPKSNLYTAHWRLLIGTYIYELKVSSSAPLNLCNPKGSAARQKFVEMWTHGMHIIPAYDKYLRKSRYGRKPELERREAGENEVNQDRQVCVLVGETVLTDEEIYEEAQRIFSEQYSVYDVLETNCQMFAEKLYWDIAKHGKALRALAPLLGLKLLLKTGLLV
ncbi:hypothetical protein BV22DRAFT_1133429 [Leucogyrophana mollusca]|uniref:Uncharacterized protein n=1 Tax=Leucogyrophana mollusca TaxID=85980 RepID=A0ACB8B2W3_9AGAM|nr:hypothetical protein BV22DRAFT_1133429 [Leucogyrophana mollusca]